MISRPGYVEADGSVTVQVEPDLLLISQFSVGAIVKSPVLMTGDPRLNDPPISLVSPLLSIRTRSVEAAAPFAVVHNSKRPGISPEPGVPSMAACIIAAARCSMPSEPSQ